MITERRDDAMTRRHHENDSAEKHIHHRVVASWRRGIFVFLSALMAMLLASCYQPAELARCLPMPSAEPLPREYWPASQPETQPAATSQPCPPGLAAKLAAPGPLRLTITEAVLLALENNQGLVVQEFNPAIRRTFEQQERAVFDPDFTWEYAYSRVKTDQPNSDGDVVVFTPGVPTVFLPDRLIRYNAEHTAAANLTQFLPTGTDIGLSFSTLVPESPSREDNLASSRIGLTVTQALLRGYGLDVNLASLRQARIDSRISDYEFRGFAETLIAQVEQTYWDYALAIRRIEIFETSLALAERQLAETLERIRLGTLAPIEEAAARAEVALRGEDLINARSTLGQTRLDLLRLLNPCKVGSWDRDVAIQSLPFIPAIKLEKVESHVALAICRRPDLNQARLLIDRNELELVKTRNGLLPRLDLFATYGKTGFAETFAQSVASIDRRGYDFQAGVIFEYPPLNRAAQAVHQRATLTRDQSAEAFCNLAQLAEQDVRKAYIEIQRTYEQIAATAVTTRFQEQKYKAEVEKLAVGRSTTFLVSQAERDLVASRIAEVEAVVGFLKAFVELYRLEGTLLDRRGINCPGDQPIPYRQ